VPDQGFESLHLYKIFLISEMSRPALGMNKLSYSMGKRAVFPGVQWPGRDVDHSPPFSAGVKHEWSFTLPHLYAFMAPIGTTSPVPDIINGSFFPYAEFLPSTIVTFYINTTKKLVFTIYGILTWLCNLNSAVFL
jgi:hypothetical protein